jgi:hypothetical protein
MQYHSTAQRHDISRALACRSTCSAGFEYSSCITAMGRVLACYDIGQCSYPEVAACALLLCLLLQLPIGPIGAHLTLTHEMWNVSAAATFCDMLTHVFMPGTAESLIILLVALTFWF